MVLHMLSQLLTELYPSQNVRGIVNLFDFCDQSFIKVFLIMTSNRDILHISSSFVFQLLFGKQMHTYIVLIADRTLNISLFGKLYDHILAP